MKKFILICFLFLSCMGVSWAQLKTEMENPSKYLLRGQATRSTKGAYLYNTKTEYTLELYNNAAKAGYNSVTIQFNYYKNGKLIKSAYSSSECTFFPKQRATCTFMVDDPNVLSFDEWNFAVLSAKGFDYEYATGDYTD